MPWRVATRRTVPWRVACRRTVPWRAASGVARFRPLRLERLVRPDAVDAIFFFPDVRVCPPVSYVCCLPLIELGHPSPMIITSIVFP